MLFASACTILFQPLPCEVLFVVTSSVKGTMGHGVCEVRARILPSVVCGKGGLKGGGDGRLVNDCFEAADEGCVLWSQI